VDRTKSGAMIHALAAAAKSLKNATEWVPKYMSW